MSPIEVVAVIAGLACVWLCARQNILCWPAGVVQVSLYVWIFYEAKLYSDVLLHIIYFVLQFYGWYHWLHGGRNSKEAMVTQLSTRGTATSLGIGLLGTVALGSVMWRFTDASLPFWDAGIAAFSLVAQFLLARKVFENWLFWIGVDIVAIGVYSAKGLYLTAGLYAVFLVLCGLGLREWRRSLVRSRPA